MSTKKVLSAATPSVPKDQHYIAQLLLKNFLDPVLVSRGKEMLWVYEANREPRKSTPKETAFEKYFYSYEEDGEKNHIVEHAISKMESVSAPAIEMVVNHNFSLTEEERGNLAGFIALSFTRTPWFRNQANSVYENMIKRLTEIVADIPGYFEKKLPEVSITENIEEEAKRLRQFVESGFEVKQTNKAYSIGTTFKLMLSLIPVIERMSWAYCLTEDSQRFLTTDVPVSLYDPVAFRGVGFASSREAEFRFPLSKNCCLVGNWQGLKGPRDIRPIDVRHLNRYAMSRARRFVYAPENSKRISELFTILWNNKNMAAEA